MSTATTEPTQRHEIVSRDEWTAARKRLLLKEKDYTRLGDELSAERRRLPWVRIEKEYVFEGPDSKQTPADLFDGRSQLIVYHFMYGPGWKEGCDGCSFLADHFDGPNLHLKHHDVTLLAVSRAPFAEFQPFKQRMGWKFKWVSSHGSDFNQDFHVSASDDDLARGEMEYNYETGKAHPELPGLSIFYKDAAGDIFHTYSTYTRGLDSLLGAHHFLDLTPKGRNEKSTMDWVRHHDRYEDAAEEHACCGGKECDA